MAKATNSKNKKLNMTLNEMYEAARTDYREGIALEDINGDQKLINAHFEVAAFKFWEALILGHLQAPFSLSICFKRGIGIKEDEYLANLFFSVALALNDPKCQDYLDEFEIPKSMHQATNDLTALIKTTNSVINPSDLVDGLQYLDQMKLFDEHIKLPHLGKGKKVTLLFTKFETVQNTDHFQDHAVDDMTDQYDNHQDVKLSGNFNSDDTSCCIII